MCTLGILNAWVLERYNRRVLEVEEGRRSKIFFIIINMHQTVMPQLRGFAIFTGFQHHWWKETDQFLVQSNNSVATIYQVRRWPAKWTCRSDRQVSFPGCHVFAFVLHCLNFPLPLSSRSLPLSLLGAGGFKAGSAGLLQTDTANKHYCTSPVCLQLSIRGTNQESRRASCHSDTLSLRVCVCVCVYMRKRKRKRKGLTKRNSDVTAYVCRSPLRVIRWILYSESYQNECM